MSEPSAGGTAPEAHSATAPLPATAPPSSGTRRPWRTAIRSFTIAALIAAVISAGATIAARKFWSRASNPVDAAIAASWSNAPEQPRPWAQQDPTQRDCTSFANNPPDREAVAIMQREWQSIAYPDDGELFGDWERGRAFARAPVSLSPSARAPSIDMSNSPPDPTPSGQCLACHHLEPGDVTGQAPKAGPSLVGYGRTRKFAQELRKPLYEQIYNSNAVVACSVMPRFGAHKVLTTAQIRDIVAYLLAPQSPVNLP